MQAAIPSTLRSIAFALSFALLLDQFAHAATPSHRLTAALQHHAALLAAQQTQNGPSNVQLTPEALARQRLLTAHTLYLAKSTQDAGFPASPDDAYNLVLANLKNWGRYQVVDSLTNADLVLQLRDAVKTSVVDSGPDPATGPTTYYLPSFQLTLADPSTLSPLWTVNTSIPTALKQKKQSDLVAASAQNLVSQLKLLAGDTLTAQDQSSLKQAQTYSRNHAALAIGIAAGFAAVSLILVFAFKHHAEQDQAAFCQAHNISPCPGS